MKTQYTKLVTAIALACSMGNVAANTTADHDKEVIGYITNWDPWKSTAAGFPTQGVANHLNVDMSKYTILNYSFFGVAVDGSLHSGDHRNKNIWQASEVQQPAELLMTDAYSSWDMYLMFGELELVHTLTEEAQAQGFTASGSTWTHEGYGLSGVFPIPLKKAGGQPGVIEHAHNNGVKVMASLGGWSMSKHFSAVAADPAKRAKFIVDVKRLIALGFDGIDVDWEYPGPFSGMNFTGTEADYPNFLTLMKEIRAAIGPDKLITAAFSADTRKLAGFDWPELDKYMDHYNMMTYDYNGGWSNKAGHNSPVSDYTDSEVPFFNWDELQNWMANEGIPSNKINFGMAFYGRGVQTETTDGINAPTIKRDVMLQPDGPISTAADYQNWPLEVYDGTPNYFFIEQNKAGWTEGFDEEAQVPYKTKSVAGKNYFLSYDNEKSIGIKSQYINDYSLGGAIVWTVVGDLECTGGTTTHSGKLVSCGNVNAPLANEINKVFATGEKGAPLISFISPTNGDTFVPGSDITFAANARDLDGTITNVSFSANGVVIGTDTTAPYSVTLSNASIGDYAIVATATDNEGKTKATPDLNIGVNNDSLSPAVEYTGPTGESNIRNLQVVEVTASASYDAGSVTSVSFNVNGTVLAGSETSSGLYSALYSPSAFGLQSVAVTATSNAGFSKTVTGSFTLTQCQGDVWNSATVYLGGDVAIYDGKQYTANWWTQNNRPDTSTAWTVGADCDAGGTDPENLAPVLSNLVPSGGEFPASSNIDLAVNASDSDGTVTKVDFYVNGAMLSSDTSAPYTAAYSSSVAGTVALKAVATDDKGATAQVTSSFTVTDGGDPTFPPVVNITNPGSGIEYTVGDSLNFTVEATDQDGAVMDVVFNLNGSNVSTDSTAPYTHSWTATAAGSQTLSVTATDDDGLTTSKSVTFSVIADEPVCTVDAWDASLDYFAGAQVSKDGIVYNAKWWSRGSDPATANQWGDWEVIGPCG